METDPGHQDYFSRVQARIPTNNIKCSAGSTKKASQTRVADLTGQGMRLIVSNSNLPNIGHTQTYTFTDKDSDNQLTVAGVVRWVRKGSVITRKSEIGVEFLDLPTSHRDAITRLAVQGELVISNDPVSSDANTQESTTEAFKIDLYQILAISRYASDNEIKIAFHKLVKKWHPDQNNSPNASVRFEELHKAYSVLRDPTLRARYDAYQDPGQAAA